MRSLPFGQRRGRNGGQSLQASIQFRPRQTSNERSKSFGVITGAALAIGIVATPLHARTSSPTLVDTSVADQAMDQIAPSFPGISAAVWTRDGTSWTTERGYQSLSTDAPVDRSSRFNIYSTSKAILAFALARQSRSAGISLHDTVGDIAPDLPEAWHGISIANILSHRSGLRHYTSAQDWLQFAQRTCGSPMDALEYFASDELIGAPGEREAYSSFAYVLASELLVRLSKEGDFEKALNAALGQPHDFQLDSYEHNRNELLIDADRLPANMKPPGAEGLVAIPRLSAECKFGGGGLVASASELARVGGLLFAGQDDGRDLIDPEQMQTNATWLAGAIKPMEFGRQTFTSYSLSGGAPGGRSYLLVLIEPEISVALTANVDGPSLEATAKAIAASWVTQSDFTKEKTR